jgi:hypothetical protein
LQIPQRTQSGRCFRKLKVAADPSENSKWQMLQKTQSCCRSFRELKVAADASVPLFGGPSSDKEKEKGICM